MIKYTYNKSEDIIAIIVELADNYKKNRIDQKMLEELITKIYKDSGCQTGKEIQKIVDNSFSKFLG